MKRTHLVSVLVGFAAVAVFAADASAMYHPSLGRFMQRDPVGYAGGMNLYEYVGTTPMSGLDPYGLLQRRQVSWIAQNYLGYKVWSIDTATRLDVKAKVIEAKNNLSKDFPTAGFTKGDTWTIADDQALQKVLDALRTDDKSPWKSFPGETYKCMDCKQVVKAVKDALKHFQDLGGTMNLDVNMLIAWAMKESDWNPYASAYGSTASVATARKPISTAIGILQLTRETYEGYANQGLLGKAYTKQYGATWDEAVLSNPTASMAASLFILQNGPGTTLAQKLSKYRDPSNPMVGDPYARSVFSGKTFLDEFLKKTGKSMDQLSDDECRQLIQGLKKSVR
jgi:hypothetical protein